MQHNAEIVTAHDGIYRIREEIGTIIHTHSPHVTLFAPAHEPLTVAYESFPCFGFAEPVPVTPRASAASTLPSWAQ